MAEQLTEEQAAKVQDIVRLIPPGERNAFLEMLAHELRGHVLRNYVLSLSATMGGP
jgi:hypothetical protein